MEQVIQYKANDGTVFSTVEQCIDRDEFITKLDNAMNMFTLPSPKINTNEFTQHPIGRVRMVRDTVVILLSKQLGIPDNVRDAALNVEHNQTIFGRYVDDSGDNAANSAWYRLMSMSVRTDREYSQPYYLIQAE